ncbi:MAG: beta-galactosidase, partial [Lentisphaeria bacterium]|nr:beta-galactosidase [Lentisphaeria bacterium]
MKSLFILSMCLSSLMLLAGGNPEAWSGAGERSQEVNFSTALWHETLEGEQPFTVEFCDGAKGKVEIISGAGRNGSRALLTEKSNNTGYIVIKFKKVLPVKNGDKLQFNAFYQGKQAVAKYSGAALRLLPVGSRDFGLYSFYPGIYGGERMQLVVNTPGKNWEKKIGQRIIKDKITQVEPVLLLTGAASSAVWDDFYIENEKAAADNWNRFLRRSSPRDRSGQGVSDAEVDKILANSIDHTGKVVKIDGKARLLIDGKIAAPIINEPYMHYIKGKNYSNAKEFSEAGVELMRPFIRLGEAFPQKTYPGFWKVDGSLDIAGAIDMIRQTMRMAPHCKIVLTIGLQPYWKFAEKYPSEAWINEKGHPVYGNGIHLAEMQNGKRPNDRYCVWPSYYSSKLHDEYKKQIALLVAELKRTGLSKAVVGLHIAGGHDNQMTVAHFDYSPHAIREFRKFLKEEYGTVEALRKAWNDPAVTFETAYAARINTTKDCFSPEKEQPIADFYRFNKIGAWRIAGEIGDYARKLFGKDIFLVRYCLGPYSGNFGATMDFDDFLRNQKFDAICGQAPYGTRPPGAVNQQTLPLASLHRHGKLYINEFDLRTYIASPKWEKELMSVTWGLLTDIESWRSANRKLAGVMFANDMGFWYTDGAPGKFDDDQIMADIKGVVAVGKDEVARPALKWQPEVALVVDGKGMFYRNPSARYMFDFTSLVSYQ